MSDIDLDSTIGAVTVGLFLTIYLTSATNDRLFNTYLRRSLDELPWKLALSFVGLASTAHTAILCFAVYRYLVTGFADFENLRTAEWSFVAHLALFSFIALVSQLYYATKISTLYSGKRRTFLLVGIIFLALAQAIFGSLSAWSTTRLPLTANIYAIRLREALGWQIMANITCAVVCDILICGAMLVDHRNPRYTVRSETFLEFLSRLIIGTNLLTTLIAAINLILNLVYKANGISTAFAIVTPKLYLLGMLASLNHKDINRGGGVSSRDKHNSSLSDMFKGTPLNKLRSDVTTSKIGAPMGIHTPINDRFQSHSHLNSPTWLRRTVQQPFSNVVDVDPFAPPLPPGAAGLGTSSATNPSSLHPPSSKSQADNLSVSDYGDFLGHAYSSSVEIATSPQRATFAHQVLVGSDSSRARYGFM